MGLMDDPTSGAQLVLTPHPVTLDGQRHIAAAMEPGEKLGPFLRRVVPDWDGDCWEVRVNGVLVPVEVLDRVRPKPGAVIEVRGIVKKQVLAIVAMAALTYFTFGIGTAAGWGAGAAAGAFGGGLAGAAFASAVFAGGAMLINKVLGPKPPASQSAQQNDPVFSINSARNAPRPYEPLPLLFGTVRITPDIASMPYVWYEGNDQYMGMVLTPGLNVHSIEELYNGETPLASFEGVQTYLNGFPGHADQLIPLYSNADSLAGGELQVGGPWVERTSSPDTVRLQLDFEGVLYDVDGKGRLNTNTVTIQIQYRKTGETNWQAAAPLTISSRSTNTIRRTVTLQVPPGQYDVRAQLGTPTWNEGTPHDDCRFTWTVLKSIQPDEADYTGIPRIGIRIKATGQINGTLDEMRCVAHSRPVPVWNGTAWVTEHTSNPGAHMLAYARGIYDSNGRLLAGMGLPDGMIDIPALQAFMVHCAANGYTYDAYIKDGRTHAEMCDAFALAGFGQTSWAGGRLSVVWASADQPLTGVVNMATIKRGSFQVDYTLANAADGIEYTYVDAETWTTATLRVPAPGVTTMHNPARITGEGVTSEAHAARLARYHLAQSLYQYKDISYSTDLEHLTYRRMSVLALSHDLTQWGYGGRVLAAEESAGTVTITLDQPVPAPTSGNAYVGLRIPGEGAYRVFQVAPFSGESDTLTLVGAWPGDAAFPGDDAANPAHDTLWIYDFKATPGYRVRVVQIEPEGDLRGARVAVVPESPEFWTYVETGQYTPPAGGSQLLTRPVASNLRIAELQTVQGDTVFTELQATFDVTGPMSYATVHLAQQLDGEWSEVRQVAETRTQQARFRIPGAGVYSITVRPYNADGIVGGAVSTTYVTSNADIPPPPFDSVSVTDAGAGVRKYSWSYDSSTIQAPDFAGAEVRYIAGTHAAPDWSAMSPVVGDGFHTAPFEALAPESGAYTFAFRARNTSGELSEYTLTTVTLGSNLGENMDELIQELVDAQTAIDQAVADALEAKLAAAGVAALAGTPWDDETTWDTDDVVYHNGRMYRALQPSTDVEPPDAAYWADIGTITEAQSDTAQAIQQLITDVDGNAQAITQVSQDLGDTQASVTQLMEVSASARTSVVPIPNSGFEHNYGWIFQPETAYHTTSPHSGSRVIIIGTNQNTPVGITASRDVRTAKPFEIDSSRRLRVSFWNRVTQFPPGTANVRGRIRWYDASGATIATTVSATAPTVNRPWTLIVGEWLTPPAGAAFADVLLGVSAAQQPMYCYFDDVMVEVETPALATQNARHTVALDVNGHVSGTINENDGQTSSFSILASVFRVLAPGSPQGMEWQAGYLRIYGSGYQLVMGNGFGASSNLVYWFGANIGAAACTTSNCIEAKTTAGATVIRGTSGAGRMEISNTLLQVYDSSNTLRVRLGVW